MEVGDENNGWLIDAFPEGVPAEVEGHIKHLIVDGVLVMPLKEAHAFYAKGRIYDPGVFTWRDAALTLLDNSKYREKLSFVMGASGLLKRDAVKIMGEALSETLHLNSRNEKPVKAGTKPVAESPKLSDVEKEEHVARLRSAIWLREQVSALPKPHLNLIPISRAIQLTRLEVANSAKKVAIVIDGDQGVGKTALSHWLTLGGLGLLVSDVFCQEGDWVISDEHLKGMLHEFIGSNRKVMIFEGVSSKIQFLRILFDMPGISDLISVVTLELPRGFYGELFSSKAYFDKLFSRDPHRAAGQTTY